MITRDITYQNLDGQTVTKKFWFQLTQAEFVKKAMTEGGEAYLEKLQKLSQLTEADLADGAGKLIMNTFEDILGDAVGIREGDNFLKGTQIRNDFMYSGAYDSFFMQLINEPDSGAAFMKGIMPSNAQQAIEKALAERPRDAEGQPITTVAETVDQVQPATPEVKLGTAAPQLAEASKDGEPAWFKEGRYPTLKELRGASKEDMALATRLKQDKYFG